MKRDGNTRKHLIDSAYKVLARQGYDSTSIKDIAREAGVSPGLVHYYFVDKEELLSAVVQEATEAYCQQMEQMNKSFSGEELAGKALTEPMQRTRTHADWYKLRYELYVLGLRNETIQPSVREFLNRATAGVEETVQAVASGPIDHSAELAAILLSCFDGLAMHALVDPEFQLESAYQVLAEMAMQYLQSRTRP